MEAIPGEVFAVTAFGKQPRHVIRDSRRPLNEFERKGNFSGKNSVLYNKLLNFASIITSFPTRNINLKCNYHVSIINNYYHRIDR